MIITNANDLIFNTEYLYLGIFSDTGCSFQIVFSFKVEIPVKPFGSGHTPKNKSFKRKSKDMGQTNRDPLDFLYEEISETEMTERKRNHHDYYKTIIDAILADGRAYKDLMTKIKQIKDKRFEKATGKTRETAMRSTIGMSSI